jgi:hypothetical protein
MEKYICESCGKEFTEDYRIGRGSKNKPKRFCSNSCQKSYSSKHVKNRYSSPIGEKRGRYKSYKKEPKQKCWKCKVCGETFETRRLLLDHKREQGHQTNYTAWKEKHLQKCEFCGGERMWTNSHFSFHKNHCIMNPNRKENNFWLGKKHKEETKEKTRESTIEYLKALDILPTKRFNKNACKYIDNLNKEKNWNLQHAMNGGEIQVAGYFLDGYDENLNIAFEYDEKSHYTNVLTSKLREKDILRQNNIIEKLKCEFWRYNEKMGYLYKIN